MEHKLLDVAIGMSAYLTVMVWDRSDCSGWIEYLLCVWRMRRDAKREALASTRSRPEER